MASICFTSVCTGNHYGFFVPLFIYSIKKAYPDAGVKVFVKGRLKPTVHECLHKINYSGWEVIENNFSGYPDVPSVTNSLRFLLPEKYFIGWDYILIRDIDFIMLPHEPSHLDYFKKRMKDSCYYGVRGPYNFPRRLRINGIGWKNEFTRIAGGTVLLKNPDWFCATRKAVKKYKHNLKHKIPDGFDKHIPASYREYDEVMLFRICKQSGLRTPRIKNKDLFNHSISNAYRDVHLGDFGKTSGRPKRLNRILAKESAEQFIALKDDPVWMEIVAKVSKNDKIETMLKRAERYLKKF